MPNFDGTSRFTLNLILIIVSTDCIWRQMNEKDGEIAGSPCLISVLGIVYSKEGMPLVPAGV